MLKYLNINLYLISYTQPMKKNNTFVHIIFCNIIYLELHKSAQNYDSRPYS